MGASGVAVVDFGAFPGSPEASVDVAGQSGFVAASEVDGYVAAIATTGGTTITNHTIDEHYMEDLDVRAQYKVDGTLTLIARPLWRQRPSQAGRAERHTLFGTYSIGWAWN